ncbi:hypothetical protein HID58_043882, partial [Brassica napus]
MSKGHTSNLLQLQAIQRLGVRSTNGRFQNTSQTFDEQRYRRNSKAKLPIKTTLRGDYTWEKDGTLVSSEQVGLTGVRGDRFEFPLTVPELALLTVEVHAREGRLLGTDMFVCGELRQGIRYVPLYDHKGERFVVLGYTSN